MVLSRLNVGDEKDVDADVEVEVEVEVGVEDEANVDVCGVKENSDEYVGVDANEDANADVTGRRAVCPIGLDRTVSESVRRVTTFDG